MSRTARPSCSSFTGSRFSSNYGTSSAFSANANPNEDWTKISDLAERRRIQNRIAQRNYRKKLKRRLEDLERRANSDSASPEGTPAEMAPSKPRASKQSSRQLSSSSSSGGSATGVGASLSSSSPPKAGRKSWSETATEYSNDRYLAYSAPEDKQAVFSQPSTRQLSASPPIFSYPSYSYTTATYTPPVYAQQSPYRWLQSPYEEYLGPHSYMESLPPVSMPVVNPAKPATTSFGDEDILNPFSMSFASMAGIDMSASSSQSDVHLQTPPLTDPFLYDLSNSPSPASSLKGYPTTPEPDGHSPRYLSFI